MASTNPKELISAESVSAGTGFASFLFKRGKSASHTTAISTRPIPMPSRSEGIATPSAWMRSVMSSTTAVPMMIAAMKRQLGRSPNAAIASAPMTTGRVPKTTPALAAEVNDKARISRTV
jgi:hypothetical protein